MPKVYKECLNDMKSPIKLIMDGMEHSIYTIVPEKQEELYRSCPDFELEFVDTSNIIADVDVGKRYMRISRKLVELFWCSAYAHFIFYSKYFSGKKIDEPTVINPNDDEEVSKGLKLLRWVLNSILSNDKSDKWPENLPYPIKDAPVVSYLTVADEICLSAVASVLHHELAHIILNHTPPSNIDQEKEADIYSLNYILEPVLNDNKRESKLMLTKRAFGYLISMHSLVMLGIYTGHYDGIKHPKSYDRLYNCLNENIDDPNHIIWGFLNSILKLHIDNSNIPVDSTIVFDNHKECANYYIDLLSHE